MRQTDIAAQIDYLYWLRDRILARVASLDGDAWTAADTVTSRDLRATLVHELDVELSWRKRVRGEPPSEWREVFLEAGDYPTLASLADHWQRDEAEMREWLAGLDEAGLEAPVTANELPGYPLSIHLLHVIDHGIQSFSEAAVLLSAAGRSPGDLDFLDFYDSPERRAEVGAG
jgi:uncharacterized damage-inducible protein DinB